MLDDQLFKQDLFLNSCRCYLFKVFALNRCADKYGRLSSGRSAKEGAKLSRKFVWCMVGQAHPAEEFAFPKEKLGCHCVSPLRLPHKGQCR